MMSAHGQIVIIKKTGVDGSCFPVLSRTCKIGSGHVCDIRVQREGVSNEQCIIETRTDAQVWIRNLTKNQTLLNGVPLSNDWVALKHKDVFLVSDRAFRWEYMPGSKFYSITEDESQQNVKIPCEIIEDKLQTGPTNRIATPITNIISAPHKSVTKLRGRYSLRTPDKSTEGKENLDNLYRTPVSSSNSEFVSSSKGKYIKENQMIGMPMTVQMVPSDSDLNKSVSPLEVIDISDTPSKTSCITGNTVVTPYSEKLELRSHSRSKKKVEFLSNIENPPKENVQNESNIIEVQNMSASKRRPLIAEDSLVYEVDRESETSFGQVRPWQPLDVNFDETQSSGKRSLRKRSLIFSPSVKKVGNQCTPSSKSNIQKVANDGGWSISDMNDKTPEKLHNSDKKLIESPVESIENFSLRLDDFEDSDGSMQNCTPTFSDGEETSTSLAESNRGFVNFAKRSQRKFSDRSPFTTPALVKSMKINVKELQNYVDDKRNSSIRQTDKIKKDQGSNSTEEINLEVSDILEDTSEILDVSYIEEVGSVFGSPVQNENNSINVTERVTRNKRSSIGSSPFLTPALQKSLKKNKQLSTNSLGSEFDSMKRKEVELEDSVSSEFKSRSIDESSVFSEILSENTEDYDGSLDENCSQNTSKEETKELRLQSSVNIRKTPRNKNIQGSILPFVTPVIAKSLRKDVRKSSENTVGKSSSKISFSDEEFKDDFTLASSESCESCKESLDKDIQNITGENDESLLSIISIANTTSKTFHTAVSESDSSSSDKMYTTDVSSDETSGMLKIPQEAGSERVVRRKSNRRSEIEAMNNVSVGDHAIAGSNKKRKNLKFGTKIEPDDEVPVCIDKCEEITGKMHENVIEEKIDESNARFQKISVSSPVKSCKNTPTKRKSLRDISDSSISIKEVTASVSEDEFSNLEKTPAREMKMTVAEDKPARSLRKSRHSEMKPEEVSINVDICEEDDEIMDGSAAEEENNESMERLLDISVSSLVKSSRKTPRTRKSLGGISDSSMLNQEDTTSTSEDGVNDMVKTPSNITVAIGEVKLARSLRKPRKYHAEDEFSIHNDNCEEKKKIMDKSVNEKDKESEARLIDISVSSPVKSSRKTPRTLDSGDEVSNLEKTYAREIKIEAAEDEPARSLCKSRHTEMKPEEEVSINLDTCEEKINGGTAAEENDESMRRLLDISVSSTVKSSRKTRKRKSLGDISDSSMLNQEVTVSHSEVKESSLEKTPARNNRGTVGEVKSARSLHKPRKSHAEAEEVSIHNDNCEEKMKVMDGSVNEEDKDESMARLLELSVSSPVKSSRKTPTYKKTLRGILDSSMLNKEVTDSRTEDKECNLEKTPAREIQTAVTEDKPAMSLHKSRHTEIQPEEVSIDDDICEESEEIMDGSAAEEEKDESMGRFLDISASSPVKSNRKTPRTRKSLVGISDLSMLNEKVNASVSEDEVNDLEKTPAKDMKMALAEDKPARSLRKSRHSEMKPEEVSIDDDICEEKEVIMDGSAAEEEKDESMGRFLEISASSPVKSSRKTPRTRKSLRGISDSSMLNEKVTASVSEDEVNDLEKTPARDMKMAVAEDKPARSLRKSRHSEMKPEEVSINDDICEENEEILDGSAAEAEKDESMGRFLEISASSLVKSSRKTPRTRKSLVGISDLSMLNEKVNDTVSEDEVSYLEKTPARDLKMAVAEDKPAKSLRKSRHSEMKPEEVSTDDDICEENEEIMDGGAAEEEKDESMERLLEISASSPVKSSRKTPRTRKSLRGISDSSMLNEKVTDSVSEDEVNDLEKTPSRDLKMAVAEDKPARSLHKSRHSELKPKEVSIDDDISSDNEVIMDGSAAEEEKDESMESLLEISASSPVKSSRKTPRTRKSLRGISDSSMLNEKVTASVSEDEVNDLEKTPARDIKMAVAEEKPARSLRKYRHSEMKFEEVSIDDDICLENEEIMDGSAAEEEKDESMGRFLEISASSPVKSSRKTPRTRKSLRGISDSSMLNEKVTASVSEDEVNHLDKTPSRDMKMAVAEDKPARSLRKSRHSEMKPEEISIDDDICEEKEEIMDGSAAEEEKDESMGRFLEISASSLVKSSRKTPRTRKSLRGISDSSMLNEKVTVSVSEDEVSYLEKTPARDLKMAVAEDKPARSLRKSIHSEMKPEEVSIDDDICEKNEEIMDGGAAEEEKDESMERLLEISASSSVKSSRKTPRTRKSLRGISDSSMLNEKVTASVSEDEVNHLEKTPSRDLKMAVAEDKPARSLRKSRHSEMKPEEVSIDDDICEENEEIMDGSAAEEEKDESMGRFLEISAISPVKSSRKTPRTRKSLVGISDSSMLNEKVTASVSEDEVNDLEKTPSRDMKMAVAEDKPARSLRKSRHSEMKPEEVSIDDDIGEENEEIMDGSAAEEKKDESMGRFLEISASSLVKSSRKTPRTRKSLRGISDSNMLNEKVTVSVSEDEVSNLEKTPAKDLKIAVAEDKQARNLRKSRHSEMKPEEVSINDDICEQNEEILDGSAAEEEKDESMGRFLEISASSPVKSSRKTPRTRKSLVGISDSSMLNEKVAACVSEDEVNDLEKTPARDLKMAVAEDKPARSLRKSRHSEMKPEEVSIDDDICEENEEIMDGSAAEEEKDESMGRFLEISASSPVKSSRKTPRTRKSLVGISDSSMLNEKVTASVSEDEVNDLEKTPSRDMKMAVAEDKPARSLRKSRHSEMKHEEVSIDDDIGEENEEIMDGSAAEEEKDESMGRFLEIRASSLVKSSRKTPRTRKSLRGISDSNMLNEKVTVSVSEDEVSNLEKTPAKDLKKAVAEDKQARNLRKSRHSEMKPEEVSINDDICEQNEEILDGSAAEEEKDESMGRFLEISASSPVKSSRKTPRTRKSLVGIPDSSMLNEKVAACVSEDEVNDLEKTPARDLKMAVAEDKPARSLRKSRHSEMKPEEVSIDDDICEKNEEIIDGSAAEEEKDESMGRFLEISVSSTVKSSRKTPRTRKSLVGISDSSMLNEKVTASVSEDEVNDLEKTPSRDMKMAVAEDKPARSLRKSRHSEMKPEEISIDDDICEENEEILDGSAAEEEKDESMERLLEISVSSQVKSSRKTPRTRKSLVGISDLSMLNEKVNASVSEDEVNHLDKTPSRDMKMAVAEDKPARSLRKSRHSEMKPEKVSIDDDIGAENEEIMDGSSAEEEKDECMGRFLEISASSLVKSSRKTPRTRKSLRGISDSNMLNEKVTVSVSEDEVSNLEKTPARDLKIAVAEDKQARNLRKSRHSEMKPEEVSINDDVCEQNEEILDGSAAEEEKDKSMERLLEISASSPVKSSRKTPRTRKSLVGISDSSMLNEKVAASVSEDEVSILEKTPARDMKMAVAEDKPARSLRKPRKSNAEPEEVVIDHFNERVENVEVMDRGVTKEDKDESMASPLELSISSPIKSTRKTPRTKKPGAESTKKVLKRSGRKTKNVSFLLDDVAVMNKETMEDMSSNLAKVEVSLIKSPDLSPAGSVKSKKIKSLNRKSKGRHTFSSTPLSKSCRSLHLSHNFALDEVPRTSHSLITEMETTETADSIQKSNLSNVDFDESSYINISELNENSADVDHNITVEERQETYSKSQVLSVSSSIKSNKRTQRNRKSMTGDSYSAFSSLSLSSNPNFNDSSFYGDAVSDFGNMTPSVIDEEVVKSGKSLCKIKRSLIEPNDNVLESNDEMDPSFTEEDADLTFVQSEELKFSTSSKSNGRTSRNKKSVSDISDLVSPSNQKINDSCVMDGIGNLMKTPLTKFTQENEKVRSSKSHRKARRCEIVTQDSISVNVDSIADSKREGDQMGPSFAEEEGNESLITYPSLSAPSSVKSIRKTPRNRKFEISVSNFITPSSLKGNDSSCWDGISNLMKTPVVKSSKILRKTRSSQAASKDNISAAVESVSEGCKDEMGPSYVEVERDLYLIQSPALNIVNSSKSSKKLVKDTRSRMSRSSPSSPLFKASKTNANVVMLDTPQGDIINEEVEETANRVCRTRSKINEENQEVSLIKSPLLSITNSTKSKQKTKSCDECVDEIEPSFVVNEEDMVSSLALNVSNIIKSNRKTPRNKKSVCGVTALTTSNQKINDSCNMDGISSLMLTPFKITEATSSNKSLDITEDLSFASDKIPETTEKYLDQKNGNVINTERDETSQTYPALTVAGSSQLRKKTRRSTRSQNELNVSATSSQLEEESERSISIALKEDSSVVVEAFTGEQLSSSLSEKGQSDTLNTGESEEGSLVKIHHPVSSSEDARGVKESMTRKSPKSRYSDFRGVRELYIAKSPECNYLNVSGIENLFSTYTESVKEVEIEKPCSELLDMNPRKTMKNKNLNPEQQQSNSIPVVILQRLDRKLSQKYLRETVIDVPPKGHPLRSSKTDDKQEATSSDPQVNDKNNLLLKPELSKNIGAVSMIDENQRGENKISLKTTRATRRKLGTISQLGSSQESVENGQDKVDQKNNLTVRNQKSKGADVNEGGSDKVIDTCIISSQSSAQSHPPAIEKQETADELLTGDKRPLPKALARRTRAVKMLELGITARKDSMVENITTPVVTFLRKAEKPKNEVEEETSVKIISNQKRKTRNEKSVVESEIQDTSKDCKTVNKVVRKTRTRKMQDSNQAEDEKNQVETSESLVDSDTPINKEPVLKNTSKTNKLVTFYIPTNATKESTEIEYTSVKKRNVRKNELTRKDSKDILKDEEIDSSESIIINSSKTSNGDSASSAVVDKSDVLGGRGQKRKKMDRPKEPDMDMAEDKNIALTERRTLRRKISESLNVIEVEPKKVLVKKPKLSGLVNDLIDEKNYDTKSRNAKDDKGNRVPKVHPTKKDLLESEEAHPVSNRVGRTLRGNRTASVTVLEDSEPKKKLNRKEKHTASPADATNANQIGKIINTKSDNVKDDSRSNVPTAKSSRKNLNEIEEAQDSSNTGRRVRKRNISTCVTVLEDSEPKKKLNRKEKHTASPADATNANQIGEIINTKSDNVKDDSRSNVPTAKSSRKNLNEIEEAQDSSNIGRRVRKRNISTCVPVLEESEPKKNLTRRVKHTTSPTDATNENQSGKNINTKPENVKDDSRSNVPKSKSSKKDLNESEEAPDSSNTGRRVMRRNISNSVSVLEESEPKKNLTRREKHTVSPADATNANQSGKNINTKPENVEDDSRSNVPKSKSSKKDLNESEEAPDSSNTGRRVMRRNQSTSVSVLEESEPKKNLTRREKHTVSPADATNANQSGKNKSENVKDDSRSNVPKSSKKDLNESEEAPDSSNTGRRVMRRNRSTSNSSETLVVRKATKKSSDTDKKTGDSEEQSGRKVNLRMRKEIGKEVIEKKMREKKKITEVDAGRSLRRRKP